MYKISFKPQKVPQIRTKYRTIKTQIPSPSFHNLYRRLSKYDAALKDVQLPILWDKAENSSVSDKDGNRWIDFTSSIFVTNSGHGNKEIKRGIIGQLNKPLLHSYIYPTEVKTEFLEELINITPDFCEKAYLFSAGTEATECALRIIRAYGQTFKKQRKVIVSFQGAMHGVTLGAEFLRGKPAALENIGYKDPYIYLLPFPLPWENHGSKKYDWSARFHQDMAVLKKQGLNFKDIAGFMVETFRGWGAIFYPKAYIQELAKFARKNKSLVAIDDIQGGLGRTGKLFAYEHYSIKPDLLCLGKGLSGSLPMSAILGRAKIVELPGVGDNTHSTHSGNPLSCAAALANLRYIRKHKLADTARIKGRILFGGLNKIKKKFSKRISYISGNGLIAAVLFKDPETGKPDAEFTSRVCERAMQKGLFLVHTWRESIKIAPPLTIPVVALKEGIKVLEESIAEIDHEN
ncbi:MAG: aspartate aminotransferase family protein [Candidatus Yanofskybacteria bacterium]|nr:aspartate aminotransferase family protein [Candidatus Yanofskybacteria bacterium]